MTDLPQAYPAYLISFHLPSVMIFTDKTDNEIPNLHAIENSENENRYRYYIKRTIIAWSEIGNNLGYMRVYKYIIYTIEIA